MTYFQSQPVAVDPQGYITTGKPMEKLKSRTEELPGELRGLMDKGMKRSIHSVSWIFSFIPELFPSLHILEVSFDMRD